jgi:hypothetical protein
MTIDRRATAATQLALPLEPTPATALPDIGIAPEWKDQQRLWGPALHPM